MPYPDMETVVLEMLCQILQTDSIQTVQQWLVTAGDRGQIICFYSEHKREQTLKHDH